MTDNFNYGSVDWQEVNAEAPAARLIGSLIEAQGIPCEYVETAPNGDCVIARPSLWPRRQRADTIRS